MMKHEAVTFGCVAGHIGSRPTLPKAIEAVEYEQVKAARHPQALPAAGDSIAAYQDELCGIVARLHDLASRLASYPAEHVPQRAQLIIAHIRISTALRGIQDAERSLGLAGQMPEVAAPLDAAA